MINKTDLISLPILLKKIAIGTALAAPVLAMMYTGVQQFKNDTSYQCRYFTPAECKNAQAEEAQLRARMAADDAARAKETKEDNDQKVAHFRPAGWN